MAGRVFELNGRNEIVWQYFNFIDKNLLGVATGAQRLEKRFDPAFFTRAVTACSQTGGHQ
jgi:hypothetical protein